MSTSAFGVEHAIAKALVRGIGAVPVTRLSAGARAAHAADITAARATRVERSAAGVSPGTDAQLQALVGRRGLNRSTSRTLDGLRRQRTQRGR